MNSLFTEEAAPAEETPADENALTASAPGFAGKDVGVTVTLNEDGTIATIKADMSQQVPPICDMCDEAWLNQFVGKKGPFTDIDVVASATYTSQGIIDAVNSLFTEEAAVAEPTAEPVAESTAAPAGETFEAAAQGFQSEVKVAVTVDNGVITALTINSADETPGFGTRCAEDADFIAQFIGQTAPVSVDALAGATVTSQAVIDAVNSVFPTQDMSMEAVAPVEEAPAGLMTLEGMAYGFGGPITATVTVDANGVITALTVDASGETQGLGTRCGEEAFLAQFIGQTAPVAADVIASATISSNATINAINDALMGE